mmetsp:Transcript_1627/g.2537  ORF Transcript_1627/g.2537 Transcript_1627/m.2537 type:complete len:128 (+) Transcript_1627:191-574(+)
MRSTIAPFSATVFPLMFQHMVHSSASAATWRRSGESYELGGMCFCSISSPNTRKDVAIRQENMEICNVHEDMDAAGCRLLATRWKNVRWAATVTMESLGANAATPMGMVGLATRRSMRRAPVVWRVQ